MTGIATQPGRHDRSAGLLLTALLTAGVLLLAQTGLLSWLEWPLRDAGMRWLRAQQVEPVANEVVVVAFDEDYLAGAREPLALFHAHLADTLETLASLQPAVIGLDFALPEKSFRFLAPRDQPEQDYDRTLMIGLARSARSVPVILAATLDESARRYRDILPDYLSAAGLSPALTARNLDPRGSVILCPDGDGLIRRYPDAGCRGGEGTLPALAAQMAAVQGIDTRARQGLINYLTGPALPVLSVQALQDGMATAEGRAALRHQIAGRAVLLGAVLDYEDRHQAPVPLAASNLRSGNVPGILIQAQIYRSLMNQGLLRERDAASLWPLLWLSTLFWFGRRHGLKLALLVTAGAAVLALDLHLMTRGTTLPVVAFWLAGGLAWLGRWLLDSHRRHLRQTQLARSLPGTASPALMHYLSEHDPARALAARRTPVVLLAWCLDGMTDEPADVPATAARDRLHKLGAWQAQLRLIAGRHDGVPEPGGPETSLVLFGYPMPLFAPERQALEAARELLSAWQALSSGGPLNGLKLHIAVHAGEALAGCLRDGESAWFTALGSTRARAAELLRQAQAGDHALICSQTVSTALGDPHVLLPGDDAGWRRWREEAPHAR